MTAPQADLAHRVDPPWSVVDLAPGVVAGFTGRRGGVSRPPYASLNLGPHVGDDPAAVAQNQDRLAALIGLTPGAVCGMEQVHGADAVVVVDPRGRPRGDALVTAVRGVALVVLVADCVPVLLADPVAGVVAAVHAGRAGTLAGVLSGAIEAMVGLGARVYRVQAALGPSICGACYEVSPGTYADAVVREPASGARSRWGTPSLDLRAALRAQLRAVGVRHVQASSTCTAESAEHFSYRRDGVTGRFAGVVLLEAS